HLEKTLRPQTQALESKISSLPQGLGFDWYLIDVKLPEISSLPQDPFSVSFIAEISFALMSSLTYPRLQTRKSQK
ncbi:Hypothetical predicted protein, partial [Prunus dulcis]